MNLRATGNRLIVLPEPPPDTAGGIHIAAAYRLPPSQGRVVSAGPKADPAVAVGSMISFKPFGGQEFIHGDFKYRLLAPEDVLLLL